MKMISSTRMTSMNGVTLISCVSPKSSSSLTSVKVTPMARFLPLLRSPAHQARVHAVGIARQLPARHAGRAADELQITPGYAREVIVDHDRRDGGKKADRGRQQGFGDAGRDHGEIGGLCLGDADEAVHDAPDRSEQADEGR